MPTNADLEAHKPLILRANRALGTSLVEVGLVSPQHLEVANEQLTELIQAGELKQASLLALLMRNTEELKESAIIDYQAQKLEKGLIDLENYNLERSFNFETNLAECWVTRTIPYDQQEEFVFMATNFYMSEPVIKFWESKYADSTLIWSVASTVSMIDALERLEAKAKSTT